MPKIEKFLIVDDQDANLLFFQVLLGELGYDSVYTANHGHDAQTSADRFGVEFVISSWELKGMPGTVFVQRLRSNRKYYNTPFLIYSRDMSDNELALIKELGLPNVLKIPFDRALAKETIEKMISEANSQTKDQINFRKMEAAFATNNVEEALKIADDSLRDSSEVGHKVNTLLGEIYLAAGSPQKAEECLLKSEEMRNDYLPNKYALAKLYSVTKRSDKAIELLKGLVSDSPLNVKTMLTLSSAYLLSGNKEDAKHMIRQAEDIDPDCMQLVNERAKVALAEGDIAKTKELIEASDNSEQLAREFNMMAISMVANGEFVRGIEIYKQAIELLGGKAKTYLLRFNLGLAYRKQGKLKSAFVEFAKSYIAEPTYEKAYSAIAKTHKDMKAKGLKVGAAAIDKIKAARASVKSRDEQQSEKAG